MPGKPKKQYKTTSEYRAQYQKAQQVPNFHMYGLVVACDPPLGTNGDDMKLGLTLTDSSGGFVKFSVFCASFPGLQRAEDCIGSVARIHNAHVRPGFRISDIAACSHSTGGSFMLIRPNATDPFFVSAAQCQNEPIDWDVVNELRRLNCPSLVSVSRQQLHPPRQSHGQYFQSNPQFLKKLSDLPSLRFRQFDLQCKILHIHRVEGGRIDHVHVWDGTDIDPSIMPSTAHDIDPSLQPTFGSIVKVRFELDNNVDIRDTKEWIAFKGLGLHSATDGTLTLWHRAYTRFWKLDRPAQLSLDKEVAELNPEIAHVVSITSPPIATCSHPNVPASCISAIQRTIAATPFSKWRIFARVQKIEPADPHAAIQLWCARCHHASIPSSRNVNADGISLDDVQDVCEMCHRFDDCHYEFGFVLLLVDSTGQLPVIVSGKHAEQLLAPLRPCNFADATNIETRDRLHRVFDALTDPSSWLDVAVTVAHLSVEQRAQTSMEYVVRLIDTQINAKLSI